MTKKAIITVGISGSGKSTFARELCSNLEVITDGKTRMTSKKKDCEKWIEINRDNLRFNYKTPDWTKYKFTRGKKNEVTRKQEEMFYRAEEHNLNIVCSDTNLNPKTRNKWITLLESLNYEVEIKEFPITWEEAIKRNAQREGGVTPTILHRQWKNWLQYLSEDGRHKFYKPNWSDPLTAIVDVDGTIARMVNRHPFEWHKVKDDEVVEQIRNVVQGLSDQGYNIIYLSGRDGVCYDDTLEWIEENFFLVSDKMEPYNKCLYMRPEDNSEKDTIIKERIFWNDIADNFNVQIAIDDRPCVVSMWNDIGIPCVMAVADQRNWF